MQTAALPRKKLIPFLVFCVSTRPQSADSCSAKEEVNPFLGVLCHTRPQSGDSCSAKEEGGYVNKKSVHISCSLAECFPESIWRGRSVKRFEQSQGLIIMLY